ncbi:MAG: hypothetical protein LBS31_09075, partial [Candidatus Adiutrix sp.]|nr:hypothetical protein [Candidatus Adiutrix sp.]
AYAPHTYRGGFGGGRLLVGRGGSGRYAAGCSASWPWGLGRRAVLGRPGRFRAEGRRMLRILAVGSGLRPERRAPYAPA